MNRQIVLMTMVLLGLTFSGCADGTIALTEENLEVINREIMEVDTAENSVSLNDKPSDGLAIIKNINFDGGRLSGTTAPASFLIKKAAITRKYPKNTNIIEPWIRFKR